ncbi:hypothetical protein [uncultured Tateyamaria sp.]|uniref:hypothetical protein n=1 Tax=Tateyamaria sp. 1078 TaxID=3417464 RepID=UPI00262ED22D|nr:hypothetical protein [uncultured Tateyamaria sp.]
MTGKTTPKNKAATDRDARLKAALKANLARRKAQARARSAGPQGAETPSKPKGQDDG